LSTSSRLALEKAQLDIEHKAGRLDAPGRYRRAELNSLVMPPAVTLGEIAARSPQFKSLAVSALSTSGNVAPVEDDVQLAHITSGEQTKTLITGVSDTSAGAFVTNDRGEYVPQPRRRLQVLDLVRPDSTDLDAIEYARQTTFTNNAAAVAEATSTATGTKPEAAIAFEKVTADVGTYATWVPASRRSLSDANGMRSTIDSQLTYAVRRKLEEAVVAAMIAGAGSTEAKGANALPVAVLKLLTTMRNLEVEPTAVLLNPLDYETFRSLTTVYTSPPVTVDSDGTERLFGIPLIVTASVPDDTAVVADMSAVTVWLRSLQIYLSDSHASYFVNNLCAILAELRAALAVTATAGVGTVTGWD
jgi:HK97 family phage major capsid protein